MKHWTYEDMISFINQYGLEITHKDDPIPGRKHYGFNFTRKSAIEAIGRHPDKEYGNLCPSPFDGQITIDPSKKTFHGSIIAWKDWGGAYVWIF